MPKITDVKCDSCDYSGQGYYFDECPKCNEGMLEEVYVACSCGKKYSVEDLETAGNNYHLLNSPTENDAIEENEIYAVSKKDIDPNELVFTGSSPQRWNGGSDSYDWTEYYKCNCGETISVETGW